MYRRYRTLPAYGICTILCTASLFLYLYGAILSYTIPGNANLQYKNYWHVQPIIYTICGITSLSFIIYWALPAFHMYSIWQSKPFLHNILGKSSLSYKLYWAQLACLIYNTGIASMPNILLQGTSRLCHVYYIGHCQPVIYTHIYITHYMQQCQPVIYTILGN